MNNHILLALGLCIALLLIVLLFVWRGKAHKRKRLQELQDQLQQLAASRQLQLDRKLQLDRRIIGLDSNRKQLVYVDNTEDQGMVKVHADLQKISGCRVIKERPVLINTSAKSEELPVRQILLRLDFSDKNLQPLQIPFYREAEDGVFRMLELNGLAGEWQQHIDNLLTMEYLAKHK